MKKMKAGEGTDDDLLAGPIRWVSDGFISMAAAQAEAQTNAEAEAATAPGPSPELGESRMVRSNKNTKCCSSVRELQ